MKRYFLITLMILMGHAQGLLWANETANYELMAGDFKHAMDLFRQNVTPKNDPEQTRFSRDPLKPLIDGEGNLIRAQSKERKSEFRVQGVMQSGDSRTAVIDGALYQSGDTVSGQKIVKIESDGVYVQKGSEVIFHPVFPEKQY